MTRDRPRALNQIPQLPIRREMHAEPPRAQRLDRQPTDLLLDIRPRKPNREPLIDLPPTLVRAGIEQLCRVLGREMPSQRTQRRQMQLTPRDAPENNRKTPTNTGPRNTPPRSALAHGQRLHAVRMQRRVTKLGVQQTILDLTQVRERVARDLIALPHQSDEPRQQHRIPNAPQLISPTHDQRLTHEISSSPPPRSSPRKHRIEIQIERSREALAMRALARTRPPNPNTTNDNATHREKRVKPKRQIQQRLLRRQRITFNILLGCPDQCSAQHGARPRAARSGRAAPQASSSVRRGPPTKHRHRALSTSLRKSAAQKRSRTSPLVAPLAVNRFSHSSPPAVAPLAVERFNAAHSLRQRCAIAQSHLAAGRRTTRGRSRQRYALTPPAVCDSAVAPRR